jgi:mannose-6-phosphate isomerase-like protein (cupin superfamily)
MIVEEAMTTVIRRDALARPDDSAEFQGARHGAGDVSFIWVVAQPGDGPRLHRHPYPETFIVLEGEATFTVGDETIVVTAGDIVVGPANVPHRFVNSGSGILRQIDIHDAGDFSTEWLEER